MAVTISCGGKIILHGRSSTFEMVYQNIVNKQIESDIIFPPNVQTLMDYLYNACYGIGSDIADYLKSYSDAILFAQLVKDAIQESVEQFPMLKDETKQDLWKFHKAILEYAETLK